MDPMFGVFAIYSGAVNAECVPTETNRLRTWLKIRTTRCCIHHFSAAHYHPAREHCLVNVTCSLYLYQQDGWAPITWTPWRRSASLIRPHGSTETLHLSTDKELPGSPYRSPGDWAPAVVPFELSLPG
jgi:hypothetical protein